jgi:hypothetical protein
MRVTVSAEQIKFFELNEYLELEDLISEEQIKLLISSIARVRAKSPGYPDENCFRSIPLVAELTRGQRWGQIASELLHKKPLRIAYDRFWETVPSFSQYLDKESCGLLLNLVNGNGTFFKQFPSYSFKYMDKHCYFILVFTARHLPDALNPVVFR